MAGGPARRLLHRAFAAFSALPRGEASRLPRLGPAEISGSITLAGFIALLLLLRWLAA